MPAGRKKKCRKISFTMDELLCSCFGPVGIARKDLKSCPQLPLYADEFQALLYQDRDGLTMAKAAKKLGVSKTVYAGIYQQAKTKLVTALREGQILTIECPDQPSE